MKGFGSGLHVPGVDGGSGLMIERKLSRAFALQVYRRCIAATMHDDVVGNRQAEADTLAGWAGGEERLEQLVPDGHEMVVWRYCWPAAVSPDAWNAGSSKRPRSCPDARRLSEGDHHALRRWRPGESRGTEYLTRGGA
jgi:hypothetical protein